jgi:hypothetical protein
MELAGTAAEDNSPEDIRDLALELLDELEGTFIETEEDRRVQAACRALLQPGHYTFGGASRFGRSFLRKHRWLIQEPEARAAKQLYLASCCGTPACPCLREGPAWAAKQLSLTPLHVVDPAA